MIGAFFSSCIRCSLVSSMAPRRLSVLASLQHGHSTQSMKGLFFTGKTVPLLMKELPSMLRGPLNLATIRPIANSAICRSDEEKGPTLDNTSIYRELNASKVQKAGEKLVKKGAVVKGKISGEQEEQTKTERAAAKKAAAKKVALKKETVKKTAAEKALVKKVAAKKEVVKKVSSEKALAKKFAAEKAAAKKELSKKVATENAAAKKALASANKAPNEEGSMKKVGAMKATKRKTTLKVPSKKAQDKEKAVDRGAFDNATEKTNDQTVIGNMMDPIQELFLVSIRTYRRSEGLAAADDAAQDELKGELERLACRFGFRAGEDATTFPEFEFSDQSVDPIDN